MNVLSRIATLSCVLIAVSLVACETTQPAHETEKNSTMAEPNPRDAYQMGIEKYSAGDIEYSGFYNNFEYHATLLNKDIRSLLLKRQCDYYQWPHEKLVGEAEKSDREAAGKTTIFMSFFTPERHNDNLADAKSIWRIYLDSGGHRYDGKAKRLRLLLAELVSLYPYHTRWNTAYLLEFPVPTNAIETQPSTLTITGPLGSRTVAFPAMR